MFENIEPLKRKYDELLMRINLPETFDNPGMYADIERETRKLRPLVEAYDEYILLTTEIQKNIELLNDPEFAEIAKDEIDQNKRRIDELTGIINSFLIREDPNASKNALVEIRGGVGGEEGSLFASDLFRMYSMYADAHGWRVEIYNVNETDLGGIKEISFGVIGDGAYSKLKYESGTHRVQRVPVTESGGRIHTSAATVAVFPEIEEVEFSLDMNDLKIDTYRSSGAGGQHVNKTESAIRITHIPTGTVVECQDERSQYKNKDRALKILRSRLYDMQQQKINEEHAADRKNQVGSGDRSGKIRTYNFPQNRVTDHRITGEVKNFNIQFIINGDLDRIINILISEEKTRKLQSSGKENEN